MAVGRIVERLGYAAGLLGGFHMRNDQAKRTVVERAGALVQRAGAHPDDRGDAVRKSGDAELGGFLHREGAVLGVDEDPIMPAGLGQHRHRRGAQVMHPETEGNAARLHLPFRCVFNQCHATFPRTNTAQGSTRGRRGQSEKEVRPGKLPLALPTCPRPMPAGSPNGRLPPPACRCGCGRCAEIAEPRRICGGSRAAPHRTPPPAPSPSPPR